MSGSAVTGINRSIRASLFHFLGELLAELGDLRPDHSHAVALFRVAGEELLVIVLGDVEGPGGDDPGDDGAIGGFGLCAGWAPIIARHPLCRAEVANRRSGTAADAM